MTVPETPPPRNKWRAPLLVGLAVAIGLAFWFGRASVNASPDIAAGLMASVDPWLAWPVAGLVFIAGSFLGVPQFMLIAGAVISFGPLEGAILSWLATMLSSSIHFGLGHFMGGERLRERLRSKGRLRALAWMDRLARNGVVASASVRIVPTGPALFVNMAAGASGMRFRDFALGTALGILPKIAIIALFGKGLGEWLLSREALPVGLAVLAALAIAALVWWLRRRIRARSQGNTEKPETTA